MQMVGMLLSNVLYYFDVIGRYVYIMDYISGNSLTCSILLYICSHTFGFCKWHRLIITANLINVSICTTDAIYRLPLSNVKLLSSYFIVSAIFIVIALYNKFVCKNEKCNKNTRK